MILNNVSIRTVVRAAGYEFDRAAMTANSTGLSGEIEFDSQSVRIVVLPSDQYQLENVTSKRGVHCRPECREEIFAALNRAFNWGFDTLYVYGRVSHGKAPLRRQLQGAASVGAV